MTTVHKSRFVRIHSNESRVPVNATTLSSINVVTNDQDLHQISGVRIKSIMIPNSQYNINSNNDTLYLTTSLSATTDYTIAQGQYTIASLITALQTAINAAINPETMTITQDALTQKLTFTQSSGTFSMYNHEDGSDMAKVLGILISSTAPAATFTAFGLPDLVGLKHIIIASNRITGGANLISTGSEFSILGDALVDVPFGSYIMRERDETTTDHYYFVGFRNCSNFDLALYSEGTEHLVELNGLPWSIILEVFSTGA